MTDMHALSHRCQRAAAPSMRHPSEKSADGVVEELEPRRTMVEVFSGCEKREHGDLRAAKKRVRQPWRGEPWDECE